MAYSWFAAENSAADHPKAMELASALGEMPPETALALADGFIFRLWCWVHRYTPTGAFSARAVPQLEKYIGRAGVIQLMSSVGLVDASDDGFCVHDWADFQGELVEKSSRDAKVKRQKRRGNGAETARKRRSDGAQTAPAQDRTGQDRQDTTDTTGQHGGEPGKLATLAPSAVDLQHVWNTEADARLPRCNKLTDARRKAADARLREHGLPKMREVIQRINASDFCRGLNRPEPNPWVASFDWLITPDAAVKVLEGKYDNRARAGPARDAPTQYADGRVQL